MRPTAVIETSDYEDAKPGSLTVWTEWRDAGVDRVRVHGISTGPNRKLAERLARAIDADAAYDQPTVLTDTAGKTYVEARCKVMGRHLNADLKRLGF